MSSIEVLYELRHSFDYIIASPTEILATGFPYKEILPELLNEKPNYERIAGKYIEQYNDKRGIQKSASITVVKTSALNSFSEALKELVCQDAFTFDTIVKKLLSDVIFTYNHTDMFFNKIPLKESSGISIYIPNNHKNRKNEHEFYKTLLWYKRCWLW